VRHFVGIPPEGLSFHIIRLDVFLPYRNRTPHMNIMAFKWVKCKDRLQNEGLVKVDNLHQKLGIVAVYGSERNPQVGDYTTIVTHFGQWSTLGQRLCDCCPGGSKTLRWL
jgi:hypothetical protein